MEKTYLENHLRGVHEIWLEVSDQCADDWAQAHKSVLKFKTTFTIRSKVPCENKSLQKQNLYGSSFLLKLNEHCLRSIMQNLSFCV